MDSRKQSLPLTVKFKINNITLNIHINLTNWLFLNIPCIHMGMGFLQPNVTVSYDRKTLILISISLLNTDDIWIKIYNFWFINYIQKCNTGHRAWPVKYRNVRFQLNFKKLIQNLHGFRHGVTYLKLCYTKHRGGSERNELHFN